MQRRDLLKSLTMTGFILPITNLFGVNKSKSTTNPVVLSTWYNQREANIDAWKILEQKGLAIDAVELGVQNSENDKSNCCVGLSGNPDRTGIVTLDACIMNHKNEIGAVGALERIKNPIKVARAVMEKSPHVMLVGQGAQDFALQNGFNLEPGELSDHAQKAFDDWKKRNEFDHKNIEKKKVEFITKPDREQEYKKGMKADEFNHDTIGMIAIDSYGNLSGACTTSGMGFKMRGRLGDSPIIGAGLYVDNEVGAATATGHGEEVIRICGSLLVVEFMRQGLSPEFACKKAVERIKSRTPRKLEDIQIGFIALNKAGEFGGYALQKGFDFGVKSEKLDNVKFDAKHLI
jgi:N4-(beta-N-acetylglucosaminyl)-L-asparaginase